MLTALQLFKGTALTFGGRAETVQDIVEQACFYSGGSALTGDRWLCGLSFRELALTFLGRHTLHTLIH